MRGLADVSRQFQLRMEVRRWFVQQLWISAYAEHADGYTLAFDLRRTPMERIRLMVQFGQEFYPGWQAETAERSASEVWVRFRFPTGAIAFAKAELREILPPLDSLRRL